MKLFEITNDEDEFNNQEKTLDHLFRIQKARCQEFWIYLNYLTRSPRQRLHQDHLNYNYSLAPSWSLSWMASLVPSLWSQHVKNKFDEKFDRMIDAKIAYEKAGGTYK